MKTNRQLSDAKQSEARLLRAFEERNQAEDAIMRMERKCTAMYMLIGFIIGLTVGTCLGLALR